MFTRAKEDGGDEAPVLVPIDDIGGRQRAERAQRGFGRPDEWVAVECLDLPIVLPQRQHKRRHDPGRSDVELRRHQRAPPPPAPPA